MEVQPFMVEPWGYTGPGPHQELTEARVTGGLQGSEGSKEVRPALPREHRVQCGHRGGAGLGGSTGAQAGRRPPPLVLCGGTGTQGEEGRKEGTPGAVGVTEVGETGW